MSEVNTQFSPGGRFDNSPAVHCRVQARDSARPEGTHESIESHGCVRGRFLVAAFQPSLRDLLSLLDKPTLERVGYFQISLREMHSHVTNR